MKQQSETDQEINKAFTMWISNIMPTNKKSIDSFAKVVLIMLKQSFIAGANYKNKNDETKH